MHIGLLKLADPEPITAGKLHESKKTPEIARLGPTIAVHFDGQPATHVLHVLLQVLNADVLM